MQHPEYGTYHRCRHPVLHWLCIGLGCLIVTVGCYWFGTPRIVMLSRHFGPGWNFLLFLVFGYVWIVFISPALIGLTYGLLSWGCWTPRPRWLGARAKPPRYYHPSRTWKFLILLRCFF